MRRDQLYGLLVEYAEGTLDDIQKRQVEEVLRESPELQGDLELLRDTFSALQEMQVQPSPAHYFSNFLPRLRQRIDGSRPKFIAAIPGFSRAMKIPALAVIITACTIGVYLLLPPANADEPIYSIIKEIQQEETQEISIDGLPLRAEESFTPITEDVVATALVEADLLKGIAVLETNALNSQYEDVTDDGQILTQLDEEDIEMIFERLKNVQ